MESAGDGWGWGSQGGEVNEGVGEWLFVFYSERLSGVLSFLFICVAFGLLLAAAWSMVRGYRKQGFFFFFFVFTLGLFTICRTTLRVNGCFFFLFLLLDSEGVPRA